jgi:dolichol-phosphate mannosyltransferase
MTTVSIVIPMRNEADNAAPLLRGIAVACADLPAFEIIVVNDGSNDGTGGAVLALRSEIPQIRLLSHPRSAGQSAAIHSGVRAARAAIVCMLDGDGQNPPEELPKLWAPLLNDAAGRLGLVAGQRVKRQDSVSKRLASRIANALRSWMLSDGTRDTGCGLKGFRRDAYLALPYFNHMHRDLPALFKRDAWDVVLVEVSHRGRMAGRSNYNNLQRALVGIHDLFGVAWLIRRRKTAQATETEAA